MLVPRQISRDQRARRSSSTKLAARAQRVGAGVDGRGVAEPLGEGSAGVEQQHLGRAEVEELRKARPQRAELLQGLAVELEGPARASAPGFEGGDLVQSLDEQLAPQNAVRPLPEPGSDLGDQRATELGGGVELSEPGAKGDEREADLELPALARAGAERERPLEVLGALPFGALRLERDRRVDRQLDAPLLAGGRGDARRLDRAEAPAGAVEGLRRASDRRQPGRPVVHQLDLEADGPPVVGGQRRQLGPGRGVLLGDLGGGGIELAHQSRDPRVEDRSLPGVDAVPGLEQPPPALERRFLQLDVGGPVAHAAELLEQLVADVLGHQVQPVHRRARVAVGGDVALPHPGRVALADEEERRPGEQEDRADGPGPSPQQAPGPVVAGALPLAPGDPRRELLRFGVRQPLELGRGQAEVAAGEGDPRVGLARLIEAARGGLAGVQAAGLGEGGDDGSELFVQGAGLVGVGLRAPRDAGRQPAGGGRAQGVAVAVAEPGPQPRLEVEDRGRPRRGVGSEGAAAQRDQLVGEPGGEIGRGAVPLLDEGLEARPVVRRPADEQLVEDRAELVDVAAFGDVRDVPARELGRHVGGGPPGPAHHLPRPHPGPVRGGELDRDPPVGELHLAEASEQDVGRLEVVVQDAAAVGEGDGVAQRDQDLERGVAVDRAPAQALGPALAFDQLHRQLHRRAVGGREQVVHRQDVRMLELAGEQRLAAEARAAQARGAAHQLDRDRPLQARLEGPVHGAVAALPEHLEQREGLAPGELERRALLQRRMDRAGQVGRQHRGRGLRPDGGQARGERFLQRGGEEGEAGLPGAGLEAQRALEDRAQGRRNAGVVQPAGAVRGRRRGGPPGQREDQRGGEGVQVRAHRDPAVGLLRRREVPGADEALGQRQRVGQGVEHQAEVEQHGAPVGAQHDVRRLDVAVDEAAHVDAVERPGDLAPAGHGGGGVQRLLADGVAEGAAGHELHREEQRAVGFPGVVEPDDVRVLEALHRPRLAQEASPALGRSPPVEAHELEGGAAAGRVLRLVDLAVAALPEAPQQPVARDPLAVAGRRFESLPQRGPAGEVRVQLAQLGEQGRVRAAVPTQEALRAVELPGERLVEIAVEQPVAHAGSPAARG